MDRYATLRHGLVGAWCPSLRTGGYVLEDRSPSRASATLVGNLSWSAGALSLTAASSQYASVWDSANVNKWTGGAMSVSAWVRPSTVTGARTIAGTQTGAGTGGTFLLEFGRTTGRVSWLQTGTTVNATSSASIVANAWSFVAATRLFDGTNWQLRLAISNTIESFSFAQNPTANSAGVLSLGRPGAFPGNYFDGLIDDVRIWNRPLSDGELRLLATQRGIGLTPTRHRRAKRLGSQFWLNDGGTWKTATPWINVGGVWKQAAANLNVSGTWK